MKTDFPILPHRCDEDGRRRVRFSCLKCRDNLVLDFGEMTDEQIRAKIRHLATTGCECPGWHVECSMTHYWQLDLVTAAIFSPAAEISLENKAA
jgi:hypothetical protein